MYKTLLFFISKFPFVWLLAKRLLKRSFFVFNYHSINNNPSQFCIDYNLNVTPEVFEDQLKILNKHFKICSPRNINENRLNPPSALITFDDGFDDSFSIGGKLLLKYKTPAVYFVNMGVIYGEVFWSGLICYLINYEPKFKEYYEEIYNSKMPDNFFLYCTTNFINNFFLKNSQSDIESKARQYYGEFIKPEKLADLDNPFIFLGNHLYNHFNAANISRDDLMHNYNMNESLLKKFSTYVPLFSYPFGQAFSCYNKSTHAVIKKNGANKLFTAMPGYNLRHDSFIYSRISMYEYIDTEKKLIVHCLLQPLIYNNFVYRTYRFLIYRYRLLNTGIKLWK